MMDVAYSDERDEIFDFCENNVLSNWAQIYLRRDLQVDLFTDLDNMKIATLRGGIHLTRLEGLIEGFGLHCEIVQVDDYETVFELLQAGDVDAGVVNRVFGHANASNFDITRTPLVFSPASLRFAVDSGSNPDLIDAIDDRLVDMKENAGSIYHQSIRKWLGETSRFTLPHWISVTLAALFVLFLILVSMSIVLRYQVKRRTIALERTNLELSRQVEETMKAHLELKRSEETRIHRERLSALGQMAGGIAHDFNNLLMPILGYSDLMLKNWMTGTDREQQLRFLEIIRTTATDARETLRRLQEFLRIGPISHKERVSVARLVSETVSVIIPVLNSKPENISRPIRIVETVPADLEIIGNSGQLKEALVNLLLNSIYAVQPGGEIQVRAFTEGDKFFLKVIDTGTGMSPDILKKCTEPFFSTKGSEGTGMGLAMVYGIVKRHNGILDIESSETGTTVTIQLPLIQETTAKGVEPDIPPLPVEPMKILVIDDDINSLNLIAEYLKHDGHAVTAVGDPVKGMTLFEANEFDMVITDMAMPDASGEDVTRFVKSAKPHTPVLMITGFAQLMSGRKRYPDGVGCIVGKPFTLDELRKGIRKALLDV